MKILKQTGIIFSVGFAGEVISFLLPFTFPAGVIALLLMLFLLKGNIIKTAHIKETALFLSGNMAFFFLPSAVNIMNNWDYVKQDIFKLIFIGFISTILCFFTAYYVTYFVKKLMTKGAVR